MTTNYKLQHGLTCPSFIASADIHLGKRLYNNPALEGDVTQSLITLCDIAIEKHITYLVLVGDIFENNSPQPKLITTIREQVERLKNAGVTVVGIAGDHDKPILGESWCRVSGIIPISTVPCFAGVDYYDYSTKSMDDLLAMLAEGRNVRDVQWIFLHCQFPQLFQFTEDKKNVDFSKVDVFAKFPNLQGVIAGDIHCGPECELVGPNQQTGYLGYCGSLSPLDLGESLNSHSVLYCDGSTLTRILVPSRRDFVHIDFRGEIAATFTAEPLVRKYKEATYRPVFAVKYDTDSEPYMLKLKPLYTVGYVKTTHALRKNDDVPEELVENVRSEMKTEEKIDTALKFSCKGNNIVYALLSDALSAVEPKIVFDTFKEKALDA